MQNLFFVAKFKKLLVLVKLLALLFMVLDSIVRRFKPFTGQRILIGFSGGPDSRFLFHAAFLAKEKYGLELVCAHFNHQWRPEADLEEQLCLTLCQKLAIECVVGKAKDYSVRWNGSKEAMARTMRQQFFQWALNKSNCSVLALGHNKTDQIETFFIKLLRGSSLDGLSCMKEISGNVFRPLLDLTKQEIIDLCQQEGLSFCLDKSNDDQSFMRNEIRHRLLPILNEIEPERAWNKICDTINLLQTENEFCQKLAQNWLDRAKDALESVSLIEFLSLEKPLAMRVLKLQLQNAGFAGDHSKGLLEEIYRFLSAGQMPIHKIKNVSIVKKKRRFSILQIETYS